MGCILEGDVKLDKVFEFTCVPEKPVYNSAEFKIYGCSINSFKYPDVKINKYNNVTIKGNISELNLGADYIVKAKEVSDSHGIGYEVINIKREKPTTLAATRNFLYEILTPNQTDVLLDAYPDIVDRIMNNRLDDIDLSKTKGIKDYTFNVIKNKVIENFKLAEIVEEFRGLFKLTIVKKLYDKYTSVDKIKEVIREEPYQCLCRLGGIGFKTADSLLLTLDKDGKECQKNGKKPVLFFGFDLITSYQRAKACVDYLLDENENNGNTYMHVGDLKKQFDVLVPEAKSNLPLILKGDNDVVFDRELLSVCKKETYETEKYIAERIKEGLQIHTKWDCDCSKFQELDGFKLTENQCKTSQYMCENNIVLLVGYGGSGKSSSTQAFVNMLNAYNKRHLLLAPTGRASKRISESTNLPACTIHRFLKWNKENNKFAINEYHKSDVSFVIVDEFSMVDTYLFDSLLKGLRYDTKLILVGDYNQLPSVGPGEILKDMIESNSLNVVSLKELYRQKENSNIISLAYQINDNQIDETIFNQKEDLIFIPTPVNHVTDKILEIAGEDTSHTMQVLAPMYKTLNGIDMINHSLQEVYNPKSKNKKELVINGVVFRENDKVIQLSNMPDENVFNGDIGIITEIYNGSKKEIYIDFDGNTVRYTPANFQKFKHAYAISIHKSQGSEFDTVLIPLVNQYGKMLYRKLIYTAVTRAKKKLYLVGEISALEKAIQNNDVNLRRTTLKEMLIENIKNV